MRPNLFIMNPLQALVGLAIAFVCGATALPQGASNVSPSAFDGATNGVAYLLGGTLVHVVPSKVADAAIDEVQNEGMGTGDAAGGGAVDSLSKAGGILLADAVVGTLGTEFANSAVDGATRG
ncbi:hypothetical protein B0H34DRAFT_822774 [Crassisporium funariophilum]|nr:hypothetical protein B0H34DRAFT_822774 [Crassisporium funariophilum]